MILLAGIPFFALLFSGCRCGTAALTPPVALPAWLARMEQENMNKTFCGDEAKMHFVIELARLNVLNHTGGPFGAAVFDKATDKLVAVGVNCVVPAGQSWAHAEMTAYSRAQYLKGTYELKGCILATSCEPCAMCYGATPWSGVEGMLYGATKEDAQSIGFDEGDKIENWKESLEKRGIQVSGPILREEAGKVFELYQNLSGKIY